MRLTLLFLFIVIGVHGQQIVPGTIVNAIAIDSTTSDSYALYLPREYDENRTYPVVFIFDEMSEGAKAVQQFTIGAELTQSIIIGANFEFNDSLPKGLKQSERLINTAYERYGINRNKIILAGRGAGAIVASTSAHLTKGILGVIALNNVYIDKSLLVQNSRARFVLISGDEGPNYYKMRGYKNLFKNNFLLAGYYEYEGDTAWPNPGFFSAAMVDILMNNQTDPEKRIEFYEKDLAFGELLYKRQKHLIAFDFVQDMRLQYKGVIDNIDAQKNLLKQIRSNRTFKAKRSRQNSVKYAEILLAEDFQFYLDDDAKNAYFDNLGWWNFQMEDLDKKIDSTALNAQERKASKRLKGFVNSIVEEKYKEIQSRQPSIENLLFMNVLRTLVNPNNHQAFINAISLSAKEGDTNAALFYLEELLKSGYTDYDALYRIDGTTALRIGQDWNAIIFAYFSKSKFYGD